MVSLKPEREPQVQLIWGCWVVPGAVLGVSPGGRIEVADERWGGFCHSQAGASGT